MGAFLVSKRHLRGMIAGVVLLTIIPMLLLASPHFLTFGAAITKSDAVVLFEWVITEYGKILWFLLYSQLI